MTCRIRVWGIPLLCLLFLLSAASCGRASSDADFASGITYDLRMKIDTGPLQVPVNATYKLIDWNEGFISWSFNNNGKGDTGFIYSDGRIMVGSQDKFDPSVKDRLDGELKAATELVNSTEPLPEDRRGTIEGAVYYSGGKSVDAATWNRCGDILVESGRYGPALFYYAKSREADPSFADAWNNEGVALRNLGRYQEAIKSYNVALNLSPNNSVILNDRGESLYRVKRVAEALEDFNRSCQQDPGNSLAWYNKGVALSREGSFIEAQDCYSRAIEADSYNAQAWNNKGVALARQGRYQDALPCFSNAATISPKLAGAWANGGIVLQNLGLENKSKDAFSAAKALGYTQTKDYYEAQTLPPVILGDKGGKMPGFAFGITLICLGCARMRAMRSRKREQAIHS